LNSQILAGYKQKKNISTRPNSILKSIVPGSFQRIDLPLIES